MKGKLSKDATLKYYDVNKPITVSVDESSYELGEP